MICARAGVHDSISGESSFALFFFGRSKNKKNDLSHLFAAATRAALACCGPADAGERTAAHASVDGDEESDESMSLVVVKEEENEKGNRRTRNEKIGR